MIPNIFRPARPGDVLLITVPNYWGKGATIKEAKEQLRVAGGSRTLNADQWRVRSVHPDTYLDEMGSIITKVGHEMILLGTSHPEQEEQ